MLLESFLERFVRTFCPEPFRQIAQQTRWFIRQGKIDPFSFLVSMVFGQLSASRQTLSGQAQALDEPVTRQAIDQRYNPQAIEYLKGAFAHVMGETLDWSPLHPQAELLRSHFPAVFLLDSTSFDCTESLKDLFPSCGGAGSAANIKVLLRYELITGRLEPLNVLAGKRSDQGQALQTACRLLEGQLQLQDKGFYDAKAWQAAEQRKAFLLMPLPHAITLWLAIPDSLKDQELDLAKALKSTTQNQIEWSELYLGTKGHRAGPVRLVAFRLNPESAARQRQGLRESMRTKGRSPSAKALELAGWLLLITNAPTEKLPSSILSHLYRWRWQVELIFRQMKSVLRLHKNEAATSCRVQCEIWARLICSVLLFLWHAHANAQCWLHQGCEVSFEKLIHLMQHWGLTIARAFLQGGLELLQLLRTIWQHILINARKGRQKTRTTTWENLYELWLNPNLKPT